MADVAANVAANVAAVGSVDLSAENVKLGR